MTEGATDWGGAAPLVLLLIVMTVDGFVGGLPGIRHVLGLPLNLIRRLTTWFDTRLNRENRSLGARRVRGLVVVMAVAALAWAAGVTLDHVFRQLSYGWILEGIGILALLHQRDGLDRMRRTSRYIAVDDIDSARAVIAPLVRHDTAELDGFALSRAAVEGGTARFAERFVGSAMWYLLLGFPGLCLYRANGAVADVVGRPSPRHAAFGFVSARLDDVLSLLPAIVSGLFVVLGTLFVPKTAPVAALREFVNDLFARGIQAGYRAEGAMAGALGLALGGPRPFDGVTITGHWIGDGRARATVIDIGRALFLIVIACLFVAMGLASAILFQTG